MSARGGSGPAVNLEDPHVLARLGETEKGQHALALLDQRYKTPRSKTRTRRALLRAAQRVARKALDL